MQLNTFPLMDWHVSDGTYIVLFGSAFNQVPPAIAEVALMKRVSVAPAACVKPTCPYLCGAQVCLSAVQYIS